MKFRPVRELLEDSMKEVFEAKTWKEMDNHIRDIGEQGGIGRGWAVQVGRYIGPDTRIGWKETYIVLMNGYPVGYLDCCGRDTV